MVFRVTKSQSQSINQSIFSATTHWIFKAKKAFNRATVVDEAKGQVRLRVRSQTGTRQSISVHGKHIQGKRAMSTTEEGETEQADIQQYQS